MVYSLSRNCKLTEKKGDVAMKFSYILSNMITTKNQKQNNYKMNYAMIAITPELHTMEFTGRL
jgi:hypothetical protein